jgi:hypothetical protein
MNSASLCSLASRYNNPIPPRFLAPIDSLKIPAQECRLSTEPTPRAARLDVRRNFFSSRVIEEWYKIPSEVKRLKTVAALSANTRNTERNWYLPHNGGRQWNQDGCVEDNFRMILPERPYRGHWEFQIKDKNKNVETSFISYLTHFYWASFKRRGRSFSHFLPCVASFRRICFLNSGRVSWVQC